MDPRVTLAVLTLRAIEEAVVADSAAEARANNRTIDNNLFTKAVRHRVANAVTLYCADAIASNQR